MCNLLGNNILQGVAETVLVIPPDSIKQKGTISYKEIPKLSLQTEHFLDILNQVGFSFFLEQKMLTFFLFESIINT